MVVVQTIDHMASNLSPLLLGGTDHVQINSSNISMSISIPLRFYIYSCLKCLLCLTIVSVSMTISGALYKHVQFRTSGQTEERVWEFSWIKVLRFRHSRSHGSGLHLCSTSKHAGAPQWGYINTSYSSLGINVHFIWLVFVKQSNPIL